MSVAAVPIAVYASPDVQITSADNGNSIRVRTDETIVVRLPAQPGTGYQWILKQPVDFLRLLRSEFQGGGLPGAIEEQVLNFRVNSTGEDHLILHYVQPWAKDAPPDRVFTLRVTASRP